MDHVEDEPIAFSLTDVLDETDADPGRCDEPGAQQQIGGILPAGQSFSFSSAGHAPFFDVLEWGSSIWPALT